jgi:hypothetical protein
MHHSKFLLACAATALVTGCNEPAPSGSATANAANTAATKAPRHYCFFKADEARDWAAARDPGGNITVKGKAHVRDVRYKADLGQPEISGGSARLWLSMTPNTAYRSPDNWWDVSFTIPDSAGVTAVTVACDSKRVLAELPVKPAG